MESWTFKFGKNPSDAVNNHRNLAYQQADRLTEKGVIAALVY